MELDIDQFGQLCNKMLFNTSLPTDLQASKSSFVLDKSDGSSAIMATSIGQGQTLVTPFHMALLVSAINNDGVLMKPYVLDRVESSDGTLVEQYEPEEYGTLMTTDEAAILKDYMNYVVETGTGKKLSGQSYEAAGKTGSAEYSTGADSSHSWFVGYAHRDDKPILQSLSSWKKQVSEVNMPCRLQKRFLMHIIMNEMLHVLLKSIILISMTVL